MKPWLGIISGTTFLAGAVVASVWDVNPFTPRPFKNVEVVSVKEEEGGVRVIVTYDKTACAILRAVVFGYVTGVREPLSYTPARGPNQDFQRFEGAQMSSILIDTRGIDFDRFEMRTRHDCDGPIVDSVFFSVDAP